MTFSTEEIEYIQKNKNRIFRLGVDLYSGTYYFENYGKTYGYVHDIIHLIHKETGLNIELSVSEDWKSILNSLKKGNIDILLGANKTEERSKYMEFSEPILRQPYAVFAHKESSIKSMADFDGKTVAFLDGDVVIDSFQQKFSKIHPGQIIYYPNSITALSDLETEKIDGFIATGGCIVNQFIYDFPSIAQIAEISSITSDMTLSTRKEDVILKNILNKILAHHADDVIFNAVQQAEVDFNRKVLNLTTKELQWLSENPVILAGMADNYLPFDYYSEGRYKGIGGAVLNKTCELVGLKVDVVHGDFAEVYKMGVEGKLDVINMSKSEERMKHFIFTKEFSSERDMIYGLKDSPYVFDIYGLEGKRIAFIPGFWQYDSLHKNLSDPIFIEAQNIQQCLEFIDSGKADYFIENPTVANFYINGLKYSDIVEKGVATSDSLQYLAIHKDRPLLASILDKALILVSYEQEKYNGLMDMPELIPPQYKNMSLLILLLSLLTITTLFYVFRTLKRLAQEKTYNNFLEERTRMLFIDPLTGAKNRACFYELADQLEELPFPQAYIIVDINDLKFINDNYGHHAGDKLIRQCAGILDKVFFGELVFRMGGDEFLIVYSPKNEDRVRKDLDLLHKLASQTVLKSEQTDVSEISMATGFHIRKSQEEHFNEAIKKADNNMYTMKKKMKAHNKSTQR